MRKIISIIAVCVMLQGCCIHYHNTKSVSGKGKNIKTKVGTVEGAKASFKSTLDFWFPGKPKEPISNLDFADR